MNFITFVSGVSVSMHVHVGVARTHIEGSRQLLERHSLYHAGAEDGTHVIRSSSRNLYQLNYLASPHTMFWYKRM